MSTETPRVSPPSVTPWLEFPTDGPQKTWWVTHEQVIEWQGTYLSLDVRAECQKALAWVKASPGNRKTANGMPRFLVNWFNRSTNRPRAVGATTDRRPSWAQ